MRHARGFTLVELLVVFAILALLLGLAPLAFDRLREGAQYRDTVRTMASQLRAARYQALSEGREVSFAVDLDRRAYGLGEANRWQPLPPALQLRAVVAGVELHGAGVASIRFLPGGGATGGSIEIIRASGAGTRLRVDWLSGRVTQEGLMQ
ncbi:GspH/FimT family pseudopilin [Pseudorhodoferax sp.]|uniref:GspH/FimT family pseudopilin n=1 Tax=Pseudorhodoferax sp. TaxID=1993553 RepID=UPI002DD632B1|nr:GspH/FimT family protein [Pseudorhodoferax sp.]